MSKIKTLRTCKSKLARTEYLGGVEHEVPESVAGELIEKGDAISIETVEVKLKEKAPATKSHRSRVKRNSWRPLGNPGSGARTHSS